jgi:PAS domain S-box-containing protein
MPDFTITDSDAGAPALPTNLDSKLFESSPDCVKLLDLQGRLVAMNRNGQCLMEIGDFNSVCGMPWDSLWPSPSRPDVNAALATARGGHSAHFDAFCPTAKGAPKWWSVVVTPVFSADGAIESLLSVSRDVTAVHYAKHELDGSRARFSRLLESSSEGIFGIGPGNICTFINRPGATLLGYQPEELIGRPLHELIQHHHADLRTFPADESRIARALGEGSALRVEDEVFWRRDGTPMAVAYAVSPMVGGDTNAGAVVSFNDITHRKRTEQALRMSQERLRLATEAAELGLWTWNPQTDHVTWENHRPYDIFGVPESTEPLSSLEFIEGYLHPDDVAPFTGAIASAVDCGAAFHFVGRLRPGAQDQRWVEFSGRTQQREGSPLELVGTVADITERKLAEIALYDSRERFEKIISQAAAGLVQVDADGCFTLVNKKYCEMLGFDEDELIGTPALARTAPEFVPNTVAALSELAAGGPAFVLEKQFLRKDGSRLWATSSVNVVRGPDGAYQGVVAIIIDITERIDAVDKLREADRRKDDFLAMLAHELRNPLAPIGAAASLLRLGDIGPERVRQTSDIIGRQVRHMAALVDDLLDVSRVNRGLVALDRMPQDLQQVIQDAVEQVMPLIEARRHTLRLQMAHAPRDEAVIVEGDNKRLVQVFANLINNAAKYTPEGGQIVLQTVLERDQVRISVTDNGIGMEPQLVSRVFELFAQAERTPDRSSGGLGLGLALVKSLVELHGGTVSSASDGIGRGSRFEVCLPRIAREEGARNGHSPGGAPEAAYAGLRVLIVDDNADAADVLGMLLESDGHQVMVEHDALQALERARVELPDVCVLDIGLPRMNGNEVARRLRADPVTAGITLIAVTGYGQREDRERSLAAGFDHYLVKPVDLQSLLAVFSSIRATPVPA